MSQADSFFLLKIIKDINAVPAKLLFKNTCLYVNVYLQAVNSGLILAFQQDAVFNSPGLPYSDGKSRLKRYKCTR
jgi:hypothetical protein